MRKQEVVDALVRARARLSARAAARWQRSSRRPVSRCGAADAPPTCGAPTRALPSAGHGVSRTVTSSVAHARPGRWLSRWRRRSPQLRPPPPRPAEATAGGSRQGGGRGATAREGGAHGRRRRAAAADRFAAVFGPRRGAAGAADAPTAGARDGDRERPPCARRRCAARASVRRSRSAATSACASASTASSCAPPPPAARQLVRRTVRLRRGSPLVGVRAVARAGAGAAGRAGAGAASPRAGAAAAMRGTGDGRVGVPLRLDARSSRASGGGRLSYRWRVVAGPRRARARLLERPAHVRDWSPAIPVATSSR